MMTKVGFEHYRIDCLIGCYPEERQTKQPIYVDLSVTVLHQEFIKSDDLEDCMNYEALAHLATEVALSGEFHLLETFAYELIHKIFSLFSVESIDLKVKKPFAIPSAKCAFVEIQCRKQEYLSWGGR